MRIPLIQSNVRRLAMEIAVLAVLLGCASNCQRQGNRALRALASGYNNLAWTCEQMGYDDLSARCRWRARHCSWGTCYGVEQETQLYNALLTETLGLLEREELRRRRAEASPEAPPGLNPSASSPCPWASPGPFHPASPSPCGP